MNQYVITITRQFGSLGRPIAHRMSEILGIEYYDRDIVEAASQLTNLTISQISDAEEKANGFYFMMKFPLGTQSSKIQDEIFEREKEVIVNMAAKGPCIMVGRCSDYIFEHQKEHMNIFIYAPESERYLNCVNSLNMRPAEAKKMIKDVDKARLAYHMRYAGYAPDDPEHKDIMINSSMLGIEGTAIYLSELAKARFNLGD